MTRLLAFTSAERRTLSARRTDFSTRVIHFLRNFSLAFGLRNRHLLRSTVAKSLAIAYPTLSGGELAQMVERCNTVHPTTMSRSQVLIDACLCTWWKDEFARDSGPVFAWADSSPQRGHDWFVSLLLVIKSSDLKACATAARELFASVATLEDPNANEAP